MVVAVAAIVVAVVSICVFAWLRLLDNSWVEPTESLHNYLRIRYTYMRSVCFDESLGFPVYCRETDLWVTRITFEAQGIQFNMIVR